MAVITSRRAGMTKREIITEAFRVMGIDALSSDVALATGTNHDYVGEVRRMLKEPGRPPRSVRKPEFEEVVVYQHRCLKCRRDHSNTSRFKRLCENCTRTNEEIHHGMEGVSYYG